MEDNKTTTQAVGTVTTATNEDNKTGKTFTQADMDNLAGKIRSEEKAKHEQAIKDAVTGAIAEYERQAKLTEEQRENEAKTIREAKLKEREEKITLRENRVLAQEKLAKNNIPIDLVEFVVDLDLSKMEDKINTLAKTYNKSVETGVTDKLKGTPPVDFSSSSNTTDRSKTIVSAF